MAPGLVVPSKLSLQDLNESYSITGISGNDG